MTSTYIKRATLSHLDELAPLLDAYRQFYEQQPDLPAARRFLEARLQGNESVVLWASNAKGGAAGFCQMYPSFCSVQAEPIVVLYDLFVSPDARRMGTGRALLLAARRFAEENGFVRMDLTTAKTNKRAQALYQSLGWIKDDIFEAYNLCLPRVQA